LLQDLESFTVFLINKIPEEFVKAFAKIMMQPLSVRIRELWLDRAIPPSLDDVGQYQNSLSRVREFAEKIDKHDWPGTDSLYDWCRNAPRNWLHNRREIEAAKIRQQVSELLLQILKVIY
jgi:centromere/kinetochore protein ZW10